MCVCCVCNCNIFTLRKPKQPANMFQIDTKQYIHIGWTLESQQLDGGRNTPGITSNTINNNAIFHWFYMFHFSFLISNRWCIIHSIRHSHLPQSVFNFDFKSESVSKFQCFFCISERKQALMGNEFWYFETHFSNWKNFHFFMRKCALFFIECGACVFAQCTNVICFVLFVRLFFFFRCS